MARGRSFARCLLITSLFMLLLICLDSTKAAMDYICCWHTFILYNLEHHFPNTIIIFRGELLKTSPIRDHLKLKSKTKCTSILILPTYRSTTYLNIVLTLSFRSLLLIMNLYVTFPTMILCNFFSFSYSFLKFGK